MPCYGNFHMWNYKLTLKFRAKIKEEFVTYDISGFISFPFDSLIYFTLFFPVLSLKNVTHVGVNSFGVKSVSGTLLPAFSEAYEVKSVKHISQ